MTRRAETISGASEDRGERALRVTPRAREELERLLAQLLEDHPRIDALPDLGLRLAPGTGPQAGIGLVLSDVRASDVVIEHEGRPILLLDAAIADLMAGLALDVLDTPEGPRLGLRDEDGDGGDRLLSAIFA